MNRIFELGRFRLDPAAGVLTLDGQPTVLGARAVAVLNALVERANAHAPKDVILDAAWPGVVVEEHNLAVQIGAIRRVLAQAGGEHRIETLARRGYRFVGPVKELTDEWPAESNSQRSNLPAPLTSFIGRERELVEIKRLLLSKRLVTVTGAGGIGKTRFALQAAAEVVDAYRDGVWLTELASIRDPALVPTTLAHVLGVQERAGTPPIELLRAYLKSRQVLLILDNCEHLLGACAQLAETLLAGGKDATMLVTSRESLRVAAEQSYALQPLSLPEPGSNLEAVRRSEAVALFVERVQQHLPDFELTAKRAPAVTEVCIHLDGIPLALELAAARTQSLSVEQINARLADRFRLLTTGSRTALPRQQTLRATLDWSYDLLTEDARVVLRRLAIFPGSFTAEAASAIASDERIDDCAVIDLVSQLVSRSLVVADTATSRARYRLLETTRAYALEKLAEVGETDASKRRHGQYFRQFYEPAHDGWLRMPEEDWRVLYLPDLDNVRAAIDWAFGPDGDLTIGTALTAASAPLWQEVSLHGESRTRLDLAVAHIESGTPDSAQARLFLWRGMMSSTVAPAEAVSNLERAVGIYRRMNDPLGLGNSLARLGGELALKGQYEGASAVLKESFPLLNGIGNPKVLARYFYYLGILNVLTADLASARIHYGQAMSLFRMAQSERQVVRMLSHIAELDWTSGDLDSAITGFREAIVLLRRQPLAARSTLGLSLANLAGALTEHGELAQALTAARAALPLLKDGGYVWLYLDHLGLWAALADKAVNAAKLAGCADLVFASKQAPRQPNNARVRQRLQALLYEKLPADELERLLAEGAKLSEEEACLLALEE